MSGPKLSELYPKYYKPLPAGVDPTEVDTYVINVMFPVEDATGCILHARKKLLIPGVRSGGKSMLKDVKEARDTLNRYIALMEPAEEQAEDEHPITEQGWVLNRAKSDVCPTASDELIDYVLRSGQQYLHGSEAGNLSWKVIGHSADIIQWRFHKPKS